MRTAIQARARAALPGLAVLLIGAAGVAILLTVLRAWPGQGQAHRFQSYQLDVTPAPPWHAGQSLTLQWAPTDTISYSATGSAAPPRSVACHFWLFGPFTTSEDAQVRSAEVNPDAENPTLGGSPPAAAAAPLTLSTDLGAPVPAPVTYALPTALAPGYYVVAGVAGDAKSGGTGSGLVAQVTA